MAFPQLIQLWEGQNSYCWYCGVMTVLPDLPKPTYPGQEYWRHRRPPNLATVEHQFDNGGGYVTVMACFECNAAKGTWSRKLDTIRRRKPMTGNQLRRQGIA